MPSEREHARKAQSEECSALLIEQIVDPLWEEKTVVFHCRGGLGRTGTVTASMLPALGQDPDEAIALVRRVRSERAVETPAQEKYVRQFAKELLKKNGRPAGVPLVRSQPRSSATAAASSGSPRLTCTRNLNS